MADSTFNAAIKIDKPENTKITFNTEKKYVDRDIEVNITAPIEDPQYRGGELSNNKIECDTSNLLLSPTNTSGVSFQPSASVVRASYLHDGDTNGWVTTQDNDVLLDEVDLTWGPSPYYVEGVVLNKNSTFKLITANEENSAYAGTAIAGTSTLNNNIYIVAVDGDGKCTITPQ